MYVHMSHSYSPTTFDQMLAVRIIANNPAQNLAIPAAMWYPLLLPFHYPSPVQHVV